MAIAPPNTSSDSEFEFSTTTELSLAGDLSLTVPGVGTGSCRCSCKASKQPVHLVKGGVELDKADSAAEILGLIRKHSDTIEQYSAVLSAAKINPISNKKITVKQMSRVINVFHNVLGKKEFPAIGEE